MIISVVTNKKIKSLDQLYDYLVPDFLIKKIKIGKRVLIPFGNQKIKGLIMDIKTENDSKYKLKNIIDVLDDEPILTEELIKLGEVLAKENIASKSLVYQTMIPAALSLSSKTNVNVKENTYIKLVDNKLKKETLKQRELILYLENNGNTLKSDLNKISSYALKKLIENKNVIEVKVKENRFKIEGVKNENFKLNEEQTMAKEKVIQALNEEKVFLLKGVTGSGKTLVYMDIVKEVLNKGKEVIVLAPEISITSQIVKSFNFKFSGNIAVLHSGLSVGEKYDEWLKIKNGEVKIAIGARSAIFAPFSNLGLIIIDEEHSNSYKQETSFCYDAIDVAKKRIKYNKCPLVLGSATPYLESFARSKKGVYELIEMNKRVNNSFPEIDIVDMAIEMRKGKKIFSTLLEEKINDALKNDNQIMLFLNRRGYAAFLMCHNCGHVVKCPNCDISLTYHKDSNMMVCHYCGYAEKKDVICPICKEKSLSTFGLGTEKIEEAIKEKFPNAKVVRMDTDTTSKKGSLEKIMNDFKNNKYNILLGTQMIAKGLDFSNVSLVGVINGDTSLNLPDFRAAENTFQLLSQVSGRAGRSSVKGSVVIQTFNKDHYSIKCAKENDYNSFYEKEMAIRKLLKYPPYFNIILINLRGKDLEKIKSEAEKISLFLKKDLINTSYVLASNDFNAFKVKNEYNCKIIIKHKRDKNIFEKLNYLDSYYKDKKEVSFQIIINPCRM